MNETMTIAVIAGLTVMFGATVPPICVMLAVRGVARAVSRNPEAARDMQTFVVMGLAMIEATAVYSLLIGLSLLLIYPGIVGMA